jgi:hypothetical protein
MRRALALGLAIAAFVPGQARAWGPIGHRIVAETAALLIEQGGSQQSVGWGPILARQRFELGYYAILPDSLFRTIDGAGGQTEGPTHFIALDLLTGSKASTPEAAKAVAAIPRGWDEAQKHFEAKLGADKLQQLGSVPWRVEQLLDLAAAELKPVKEVKGTYQTGARSEGDARRIYRALYYLGLMAHYTGDATMPYHSTSDWNGYDDGHGGIHFYFEADCVNALEPGISTRVLAAAQKQAAAWLAEWKATPSEPIPGVMLNVLYGNFPLIRTIEKLDAAGALAGKPEAKGSKTWPKRKAPKDGCPFFRELLVDRLAKGAVLTAYAWRRALPTSDVDFSGAAELQFADFEANPAYVPPKYGK